MATVMAGARGARPLYRRIAALAFRAAAIIALFADFAPETTSFTPIMKASWIGSIADEKNRLGAVDIGILVTSQIPTCRSPRLREWFKSVAATPVSPVRSHSRAPCLKSDRRSILENAQATMCRS